MLELLKVLIMSFIILEGLIYNYKLNIYLTYSQPVLPVGRNTVVITVLLKQQSYDDHEGRTHIFNIKIN